RLPAACTRIAVFNLLYQGVRMDVAVSGKQIEITVKDVAQDPLRIALQESWAGQDLERVDGTFLLSRPATYQFGRN
ncbi:MAG TPA: glycosyl hydrolase family 65 protein, partial [Sedimentisphaerales bacterium]|nr:glycosyl hydrolase family 65 protein [Sedimentisphaerales bacterium]